MLMTCYRYTVGLSHIYTQIHWFTPCLMTDDCSQFAVSPNSTGSPSSKLKQVAPGHSSMQLLCLMLQFFCQTCALQHQEGGWIWLRAVLRPQAPANAFLTLLWCIRSRKSAHFKIATWVVIAGTNLEWTATAESHRSSASLSDMDCSSQTCRLPADSEQWAWHFDTWYTWCSA